MSYRQKYRGNYAAQSRAIRAAAYANPAHRCWRCGRTLAEVAEVFPGRKVSWDCGHTGGGIFPALLAECSPCNRSDGGRRGAIAANAARVAPAPLNPSSRWW